MNVPLNDEEQLTLKALEIRFGVSARELVQSFVSDLCASARTRGSDERVMAWEYAQRAFGDRIEHGSGAPITDAEMEKMWSYEFRAKQAREGKQPTKNKAR